MHAFRCRFHFCIVIFLCSCCAGDIEISDDIAMELYTAYKDAVLNDRDTVSFRRIFQNKKFEIHVKKLHAVNGYKRHNLIIKEDNPKNPLIYINNPVETKVPNAYLTYQEFKKQLQDRVVRLRQEFTTADAQDHTTKNKNSKIAFNRVKKANGYKLRHDIKLKINLLPEGNVKLITNLPVSDKPDINKLRIKDHVQISKKPIDNITLEQKILDTNLRNSVNVKKIRENKTYTDIDELTSYNSTTNVNDVENSTKSNLRTKLEEKAGIETFESTSQSTPSEMETEYSTVTDEPELVTEVLVTNTDNQEIGTDNESPTTESVIIVTETKLTTRPKLSRPLVFMEGQETQ